MATPGTIWINGKDYLLLADKLLPSGRRGYVRSLRPSAPSDPGRVQTATWKLSGPLGQSRESPEGFLGHDYSDNIDASNNDLLTSAAARNALTLTGLDPPTTAGAVFGDSNFGEAVFGPAYSAQNVEFIDQDRGSLFFHRGKASVQVEPYLLHFYINILPFFYTDLPKSITQNIPPLQYLFHNRSYIPQNHRKYLQFQHEFVNCAKSQGASQHRVCICETSD